MTDSAWGEYTADEIRDHMVGGLPVWHATMSRASNIPKLRDAGKRVYSDITAPTKEGIYKTIREMEWEGWRIALVVTVRNPE